MVNLKCNSKDILKCKDKFNIDVCKCCKHKEYMSITRDISLYNLHKFIINKSVFIKDTDKVLFMGDFVNSLLLQSSNIVIVEYSYKEDTTNKECCIFEVITMEQD